jgi:hypothetical protein
MRLLFTTFSALIFCAYSTFAQHKVISYNVVTQQINEGLPIPSEEPFFVAGDLPKDIKMVKLALYRDRKRKNPTQEATWKKPFDFPVTKYELQITDPLRNGERYLFEFHFYKSASPAQLKMLQQAIHNNLSAYIDANYEIQRNGLVSMASRNVVRNNLNAIVREGTQKFEHYVQADFNGFSDIVGLKIEQVQNARLKNARFNVFTSRKNRDSSRVAYANNLKNELKELVKAEVDQYLSDNMLVLADIREISAETEKTSSSLPINLGYGGVYFGGSTRNIDIGNAPYVGLSIPLGNKTFAKFLGDASISAGVMLTNMENGMGETVSGPIIDRPMYLALGYKLFKVFRFNAGATLSSIESINGNGGSSENLKIFPFVGLSVELNVWMGFNRKK